MSRRDECLGPSRTPRLPGRCWIASHSDPKRLPVREPREIRRCVKRAIARHLLKLLQRLDRSYVEVVRSAKRPARGSAGSVRHERTSSGHLAETATVGVGPLDDNDQLQITAAWT